MDLPLTNLVVGTCYASYGTTNTLLLFSCCDLSIFCKLLLFSLSMQSIVALCSYNNIGVGLHNFVVLTTFLRMLATLLLSCDLSHLDLSHSDILSRFLNE